MSLSPKFITRTLHDYFQNRRRRMGEVYLAEDTKLDRKVAIKFLHEEFSKDATSWAALSRKRRPLRPESPEHPHCL